VPALSSLSPWLWFWLVDMASINFEVSTFDDVEFRVWLWTDGRGV
jgi:hypothetical protein